MDNKRKFSPYPKGINALFFIQIFSTLSFSVLYSTLVLYLTGKLGLSITAANNITGVFIALSFSLHLLGGYLGGRILSNRALFCFGMIAETIGCVLLADGSEALLYYALAAFLTGCGVNEACINCMLTQRFSPGDNRRETAFLWNYAGMNIGFFIGFSLSGYFQLLQDYQHLFLFSSLGGLIALVICLYCWKQLADQNTVLVKLAKKQYRQRLIGGIGLIFTLFIVLHQLLHFADWASKLVLVIGVMMLALIIKIAFQNKYQAARQKILAFAVLTIVSTLFWTLYSTGPIGLTHFINNNVERHWLFFIIPPQWFQNINTLCIVFGGPMLALILKRMRLKGINVNTPIQFASALLLIGLAFAVLPIGIMRADQAGLVSAGWIVLSFILQSAGELLISPIGYAMIGALAPNDLQGTMMGIWMLAMGVGATLATYSANWVTSSAKAISPLVTNVEYSQVFLTLGLFAVGASFLLFLLAPTLKKWIKDNADEGSNKVKKDPVANSFIMIDH